ncbi:MAG: DUF6794 domain-containing protein [Saprospiraceae bacterium]
MHNPLAASAMTFSNTAFALFFFFSTPIAVSAQQYNPPNTDAEFERQYQERIKKDRLGGVYIPRNLDDALAQLNKLTSEEARQKFKALSEDSVCRIMHNRLGQWMVVNWSFYEGSRLSNYLRSAGVTYPDDMADFLILAFHRQVNGHPVSIRETAIYFKEKRKQEWLREQSDGVVLREEVRKRPRPDSLSVPADAPAKPPAPAAKPAPQGTYRKQ